MGEEDGFMWQEKSDLGVGDCRVGARTGVPLSGDVAESLLVCQACCKGWAINI